jgi:YVTN family beta-propeller protein
MLSAGLLAGAVTALTSAPASAYKVFVSNEKENTVSVIDSETLKVVHTIKTGARPRGIILSKDHSWLLVCASDDNRVEVYDAKTYEQIKYLPSGPDLSLIHI